MAPQLKPVTVLVKSGNTQSLQNVQLYLFSKDGQLLEATDFKEGRVVLKTPADQLEDKAQWLIAPALPPEARGRAITPALIRSMGGFQPSVRLMNNEVIIHSLPDLPKLSWFWCLISGKLSKSFLIDGISNVLPVCNARVHICEVDRIWWWWRIPPLIFEELGKSLREIILYPERIPIPVPDPDPAPISRIEDAALRAGAAAAPALRSSTKAVLKNQAAQKFSSSNAVITTANVLPVPSPAQLPDAVKSGLLSSSAVLVSETIRNNLQLLHPYLCLWPRFWPYFYVCQELATVYSDCEGRFDFEYFNFLNDKDIYVWVEVCLPNGQWVTVYRPPIPCGTRWNYTCGSDINITLTDPRVLPCTCTRPVLGEIVWFRSVGESATALHIEQNIGSTAAVQGTALPNVGCTDILDAHRISPFGSTLYFKLLFGDGFPSAGVTHYRWRKTNLRDAALNPVSGAATTVVGGIVQKNYFVITQDAGGHYHFETKAVPLGPEGTGENIGYRIPHWDIYTDPGVPAADKALTIEWTSPDFWSAAIDSHSLGDGLWRFDLELLSRDAAGNFQVVEVAKQVFQVSEYSNAGNSVDAPGAYLQLNPSNLANAFHLQVTLRIENAQCAADIQDASILISGTPQYSGACGFLHYTDVGQQVNLSFAATHPRNFARFNFGVVKGNNTTAITPSVNASGYVLSGVGSYSLAGGIFSDAVPVSQLSGGCPQAAFAENLYVYALATDGSRRLYEYDASDTNAFALSNT